MFDADNFSESFFEGAGLFGDAVDDEWIYFIVGEFDEFFKILHIDVDVVAIGYKLDGLSYFDDFDVLFVIFFFLLLVVFWSDVLGLFE